MSLTPRENLLRILRHDTPAWIPLLGHCDPYNQPAKAGMDPELARRLADVTWCDESTVHFSRALDLDIGDWYHPPIDTRQRQVKVQTQRNGNETVTVWQTPRGDLRRVARFAPETNLWYTAEHEVKTVEDLPRLAAVFEDQAFALTPQALEAARARRALIGEDGIILCPMSGTPLGQLVRVHAGVETLSYLWADGRRELHDLFAVMEDTHRRMAQAYLAAECDAIVTVDDTSTTTISPDMFEEFCLGYTDRMADLVHAAGRFYVHHSCGLIRDLLPLYRQTRMDAVHAFCPPPIGNVGIAEGRQRVGPRITLMVSLVPMSGSLADRPAVAQTLEAFFREAGAGDHIMFWLAADPNHTMEETAFVRETCRQHQRR